MPVYSGKNRDAINSRDSNHGSLVRSDKPQGHGVPCPYNI
jgi:hypothetical protein